MASNWTTNSYGQPPNGGPQGLPPSQLQGGYPSYEVDTRSYPDPYLSSEADDSKFERVHYPKERPAVPPIQASLTSNKSEIEEAPKYQDVWAAIIFGLHLVPILWLAFGKGLKLVQYDIHHNSNSDSTINLTNDSIIKLSFGGILCTVIAGIISFAWLKFILNNARSMIHCMLISSVVMNGIIGAISAYSGQWIVFGMCMLFGLLTLCYYKMVKNRIPFAATNLAVACTALRHYYGPMFVACLMTGVLIVWQFVWTLALMGAIIPSGGYAIHQGGEVYASDECNTIYFPQEGAVCSCRHKDTTDPATTSPGDCQTTKLNGFLLFLLLVSFFWGSFIISNVVHCTSAGAVADWWFNGARRSSATLSAFKRTITTSFGSVCFGSLLTAVIKAIHQMALEMRRSENNALAACAECLLAIVDGIAQYFNRYAFTYVAMYGTSFIEGGKAVMQLFRRKGLTAIINDQLVSNVFTLCSLTSAMVVGLVGYGYYNVFGVNEDYRELIIGLGILLGFLTTSIIMNVVDSAVITVFVAFAEAPEALSRNSPALCTEMAEAWAQANQLY